LKAEQRDNRKRMESGDVLTFGAFRLPGPHGPLWQGDTSIPLAPKALAVLWTLVTQAGTVVTKDTLLEAVWGETIVSEGALSVHLRQVRQALGDSASTPQYIETVHRIGYRFIAKVVSSQYPDPVVSRERERHSVLGQEHRANAAAIFPAPSPQSPASVLVGREAELDQLHQLLGKAMHGERQLVFVTGEAGIGKTALVETFLGGIGNWKIGSGSPPLRPLNPQSQISNPVPWITWGQCIEHYGEGEAYLPVLEALGRLSREAGREQLIAILRQRAPSWLVQLPALVSEAEYAVLQQRVAGTTRERMLREMVEALEILSAKRLLVIVLEDLHWSDVSTIDLLSMLARRREAARLLVVATYRPTEVIVRDHPLKAVKQEAVTRGLAVEVPLPYLRAEAVRAYVEQQVGVQADVGSELAPLVYERTGGHPFFMVQVVDEVVRQGAFRSDAGLVLPPQLRQLIAAQLERLTAEEQQVLEAGSVAGAEFSVASVAAGVQRLPEVIETICEALARRGQFVDDRGVERWPDGTASGRYGFRHALYQEVLYKRIGTGRRVRLHQLIGLREEVGYGENADGRAAGLARHFEQGQDDRRTVHYLAQAARRALRQGAAREGVGYLTRGLTSLARLPESADRQVQELRLQSTLGVPLMLTARQGTPPVEQVYQRARALCRQLEETSASFTARFEFWYLALTRADLRTACQVAGRLVATAQQTADPEALGLAHYALGTSLYYRGDWATVREHLERGLAAYAVEQDQAFALFYAEDRGVVSHCHLAVLLWCLGYPAQAQREIDTAKALAQHLARPLSQARALGFAAGIAYFRREWAQVRESADAVVALGAAHSAFWQVVGALYQGAVVVAEEQTEAGLAQLCQAVARYRAWGQLMVPCWLSVTAEAQVVLGHAADGVTVVDEALAVADETGEQWYDAELWRMKGELTLRQLKINNVKLKMTGAKEKGRKKLSAVGSQMAVPNAQHLTPSTQEAEACFLKAIDIARRQGAKSLELRAVMSLSCLWQRQGKKGEARQMLSEVYGWFTEGFDTKDLQEAQALLQKLS
jgi:DNA-binding winged helix-turn-helix (wHTH) protein/tetratricopeptide (TPR) repeat protein